MSKSPIIPGSSAGMGRPAATSFEGSDTSDRWYNRADPMFSLARLICRPITSASHHLSQSQMELVALNINKHRIILWLNALLALVFWLFRSLVPLDKMDLSILVQVLIAPAFITGGAWFAITFGAIPTPLTKAAVLVTAFMFLAFSWSLNLMGLLLTRFAHPIICIMFYAIVASCLIASILFDSIDGLKIGLDSVLLRSGIAIIRVFEAMTSEKTQDLVDRDSDPLAPSLHALASGIEILVESSDGTPLRKIKINLTSFKGKS